MPVAIKVMEILHGKKYADELKFVPLSDDTVRTRITKISDYMREQLLERIKKAPNLQFSLTNLHFQFRTTSYVCALLL
jgi:hypothetical protein